MPGIMSPRARKPLDPRSKRFEVRFARRLRDLLTARGMTTAEFLERLQRAGLDVSIEAVKKWLNGGRVPHPSDAEQIGRVLGLDDYRHLWPPSR
jgi:transcriptional regulator with XRE-family HTH domain